MNHVRTKENFGTEKEFRNRWTENFPDENAYHRRQGYLPKLVTKSVRCPWRLRVPSLNKIAQTTVRPSPLWEFRTANCFRDLIATPQNENPCRTPTTKQRLIDCFVNAVYLYGDKNDHKSKKPIDFALLQFQSVF
jgi:hypothetical protein